MKKVLYFNFNVSSGIEYIGNVFEFWLREIDDIDLKIIRIQNQSQTLIDEVINYKPDIIVCNEEYPKSVDVSFYYKKFNPNTKLVFIVHSFMRLAPLADKYKNDHEELRRHFNNSFYKTSVDKIFVLNHRPKFLRIDKEIEQKITHYYFPVSPDLFKIKIEWNKRPNNFVYIGSFIHEKVSETFLEIIKNYSDLKIDYYGWFQSKNQTENYNKKFNESGIKIIKKLDQNEVCDILNQYKYFILPHGASEVFNITLLQAILSGTIPLVSNNRKNKNDYCEWIDWADKCYFGCETEKELLNNMRLLLKDSNDLTETSTLISKTIKERVKYFDFKRYFNGFIKSLL